MLSYLLTGLDNLSPASDGPGRPLTDQQSGGFVAVLVVSDFRKTCHEMKLGWTCGLVTPPGGQRGSGFSTHGRVFQTFLSNSLGRKRP